jgi:hypothetical protein
MPRNVARWDQKHTPEGMLVLAPIPFKCDCGADACYGASNRWYCTPCWVEKAPYAPLVVVAGSL